MKKRGSVLWIMRAMKQQALSIAVLCISSVVVSSSYVIPALVSRNAINAAVAAKSLTAAKGDIIRFALVLAAVILAQISLSALNIHLKAYISGKLEMSIRRDLFKTITSKEYSQLKSYHSGEIINRFTTDVNIIVSGITDCVPQALSVIAKIASGLAVIASFSPKFALAVVLIGAVVAFGAAIFKPYYKKIHKDVRQSAGKVRSFTQECIENIVVVKSFSTRIPLLNKLEAYMNSLFRLKIYRNNLTNAAVSGISLIFSLGYYLTLCWGALMISAGKMDYGTLTAFLQIVSQIRTPFYNVSDLITRYYGAQASAERLIELENLDDEKSAGAFDVSEIYNGIKDFCAENLTFAYDKDNVIQSSTFSVEKGSLCAITGLSGTGKSTLFKLILGLYTPSGGRLFVSGEQGDIIIDASTRPLFAYVPQGNLLLSGTISENIKFGNPDISDKERDDAAKSACIDDFIASLPDGFETVVTERGGGLSEGQIQRIAVARALCSGAPVLLLDECTSALDTETEEKMLKNIADLKTKTVFFISHKNAALSVCDVHLSIENGVFQIVKKGDRI